MEFFKKKIIPILIVAIVITGMFWFGCWVYRNNTEYIEKEYSLTEITDGNYGAYTEVVSNIPAQNYQMITLCCNGQICSFKGNVNIVYFNDNQIPKVKIKDYHIVNRDQITIYAPYGSIEIKQSVGIGS